MKRYTNKDIAKMAGVSPAAVSIAINGKKGISAEMRASILDIVKKTNYYPNPNSRRLLSNRTNSIAILLRNDIKPIDQLFHTELTESIFNACNNEQVNLIFSTLQRYDGGSMLPQIIRSRDVDGVLIYGDIDSSVLEEISNYEIPFVVLDSSLSSTPYPAVRVDYQLAAYTAAKYLLDCGHTDIAYIGNSTMSQKHFNYAVFSGFQKALTEANISLPLNRIQIEVYDETSLYASVRQAMEGTNKPTALFCATDVYACYSLNYLSAQGYSVPEQVSIIGIDDIIISRFTTPSLTTIRIDRGAIGREGYRLLQTCIEHGQAEGITIPSCELILRNSVRAL